MISIDMIPLPIHDYLLVLCQHISWSFHSYIVGIPQAPYYTPHLLVCQFPGVYSPLGHHDYNCRATYLDCSVQHDTE